MSQHVRLANSPIQIWLPLAPWSWSIAPWRRDLQRAQRLLTHEARIWFIPKLPVEGLRWCVQHDSEPPVLEAAIPSETFNAVSIVHVTRERSFYPKADSIPKAWKHKLPPQLYKDWVNATPKVVKAPKNVRVAVPEFRVRDNEVEVSYVLRDLSSAPGPLVPDVELDDKGKKVWFSWPPAGTNLPLPTVSIDAESIEVFGAPDWSGRKVRKTPTATPRGAAKQRETQVWGQWPPPFDAMFPFGGNVDLLLHREMMLRCIQLVERGERKQALSLAETQLALLTSQAKSDYYQACFRPHYVSSPKGALMDLEGRFGVTIPTGKEADALADPEMRSRFREAVEQPVEVLRVLGWEGLFWLDLHADISDYQMMGFCRFCGRPLIGGRPGRGCRRDENPECLKRRAAQRQRRSAEKKRDAQLKKEE